MRWIAVIWFATLHTPGFSATLCPWQTLAGIKASIRGTVQKITGHTEMEPGGRPVISESWWAHQSDTSRVQVTLPKGVTLENATIPRLFYELAKQDPDRAVSSDDVRGVKTRRDIAAGVMSFLPMLKKGNERHIGVMLPPSGASQVMMLATQLSGKVPAVFNPTVGVLDIQKAIEISGVKRIYTSKAYVAGIRDNLPADQREPFDALMKKYAIYLEDVAGTSSFKAQFALSQARAMLPPSSWVEFHTRKIDPVSMVLFTSGSSGTPKGVEVLHANQIVNSMDILDTVAFQRNDSLLGFLPHFHSFGATATYALPLVSDVRVAYAPNPKKLDDVSTVAGRYKTTLVIGTDTFMKFLALKGKEEDLQHIRGGIFGAEPYTTKTDGLLKKKIGDHFIGRQGYGMTEAGPAISIEDWNDPEPGTVGKPLPHVTVAIVEQLPDGSYREVKKGEQGLLLVRGPNLMRGYLGGVKQDNVNFNGQTWFSTGDIFSVTEKGNLKIHGRASMDFWKIGGEMITRLKLQEVLHKQLLPQATETKFIVMPDKSGNKVQNVLFSIDPNFDDKKRMEINKAISAGGLGAVYNIDRVVILPSFPVLGTGKTDLKTLLKMANGEIPATITTAEK